MLSPFGSVAAFKVAVIVTGCPGSEGLSDEVTLIFGKLLRTMLWLMVAKVLPAEELPAKFASPR
jgi:hypothetical protein